MKFYCIVGLSESTLSSKGEVIVDKTDERILDLMKGNARISFQELGEEIGMSRVAAKKRVQKLEQDGIIRGYNTCIYRDGEVTMFIDLVTVPEKFEEVLKYVSTRTAFIRQIFTTTKPFNIHIVAVSTDINNLKYLLRMIQKACGDDCTEIHCHAVKEVIKDVYGGITYEQRKVRDTDGNNELSGGSESS